MSACVLQAVIDAIIKSEHVAVRVNGPIGGNSILSQNYDRLLFIAGGVAVSHTPLQCFCLCVRKQSLACLSACISSPLNVSLFVCIVLTSGSLSVCV